jgi:serine/threonine-protein kinase
MERRTLGDYRIEGIVGAGRMGVVYRAIDGSGRSVALKVMRDDVAIDPIYRERFRREGGMLTTLHHPGVIPIIGMGEIDGQLYIATQLTESTLKDAIVGGRIAVNNAMTILASVADALDAAHAAGVIHRDIKPANVLLDPGPRAYLTDFGLARDPHGIALTAPGQVLGTIDYMAPELLDGVRVGAATDIYALTCVAVEALTGRVPFLRENDAATTYAHVMGPPPKVSERRPELPRALDAVIAAGMAKSPEDRPATAGALVLDMLRALGEGEAEPEPALAAG